MKREIEKIALCQISQQEFDILRSQTSTVLPEIWNQKELIK